MSAVIAVRAADAAWFAANPDKRIRVRLLVPGEEALADFPVRGDFLPALLLYRFAPGSIACWCVQISGLPGSDDDARELLLAVGRQTGLVRADA